MTSSAVIDVKREAGRYASSKRETKAMKRLSHLALCLCAFRVLTAAQDPNPTKPQPQKQVVTAAQVNGVYRFYQSEFRILALGQNKLKVQFDGVYVTRAKSQNMGYAMGEAIIDGNIATFKPPDMARCEITLVFLPGKLKVMQDGSDADCGLGHNVNAAGDYKKIRSGKPKFAPPV
jgi:hypothetical protein